MIADTLCEDHKFDGGKSLYSLLIYIVLVNLNVLYGGVNLKAA